MIESMKDWKERKLNSEKENPFFKKNSSEVFGFLENKENENNGNLVESNSTDEMPQSILNQKISLHLRK